MFPRATFIDFVFTAAVVNPCHAEYIKMPLLIFKPIRLLDQGYWYKFTYWMANSAILNGRIYPGSAGLGLSDVWGHMKSPRTSSNWCFLLMSQCTMCMTSKDPDQPVHPSGMAGDFVYPSLDSLEVIEGTCHQQTLISLRWVGWSEPLLVAQVLL